MNIKKFNEYHKINESSDFKGDDIKFWVVIKPKKYSVMEDMLFESTPIYFAYQIRGGLSKEEIYGLYLDKNEAKKVAEKLFKNKNKNK